MKKSIFVEPSYNQKLLYLSWLIPVIEAIYFPITIGNLYTIIFPVLFIFYSILNKNFSIVVHSIPFFCLLSPLGQFPYGTVLYSELLLSFVLLFVAIYILTSKNIKISNNEIPLLLMFVLFFISYITSFHHQELWKGLINGIFFFSTYVMTRIYIKNARDVIRFTWSFVVAATFAAVLMIMFYFYGIRLNDLNGNIDLSNLINDPSNLVLNSGFNDGLMNAAATYYYTGIFYIISAAIVIIPVAFRFSKGKMNKFMLCCFALIIIIGIIANFNKTAILALCFVISIFILRDLLTKSIGYFLSIISVSILTIWVFSLQVDYSYRGFEFSSLYNRFNTYISAISVVFKNLHMFLFGLGPESAFRLTDNKILNDAKTHSGITEGAIDSAYFTYLFEYGIFFVFLFFIYGINMVIKLFSETNINNKNSYILSIRFSYGLLFLCVLIIGITQILGIGKIAIVIFQLFACSHVLLTNAKINDT